MNISSNANVVAADIGKAGAAAVRRMAVIVPEAAIDVRDEWRANATETAGAHGRHYPRSIRYVMRGALTAIIEPDASRSQGSMSFEFGSRNQPPHLDGQRALDALAPRIERRIALALDVF